MREYSINELFCLTRAELMGLDHEMAVAISQFPAMSVEHTVALLNQRLIRRELGRRDYSLTLQ